jgi:tRNA threonylcarbamoyladenosine biosynthesis protein TsaB
MINILAIDSSVDICSLALLRGTDLTQRDQRIARQQANSLLPMIDSLMKESAISLSQLDAIAVTCGPGSFTGIRIGVSVAQSIAFAADLPVIPISTLQVLAQGAYRKFNASQVLVGLDARMQQIYWAGYCLDQQAIMRAQISDQLLNPQELELSLPSDLSNWIIVGNALTEYAQLLSSFSQLTQAQYPLFSSPQASDMIEIAKVFFSEGKAVSPELALPVYLREQDAWKKLDPKPFS